MASSSCADAEKSGIAARLWAAAKNTVNMLTNVAVDETSFRPIENMWDKSPHDEKNEEMETMDMGLKIDSVFTLPLDTYLKQHEEEYISQPIEQILKVEQQAKSRAALCKPCSVVLQKIDHDLAGRHRVFYRQWKRRFDKCGYSCRYKFISNRLRPQPKTPTKTRKQYTHKQSVMKSDSMNRSCLGNAQRSDGRDDTPYKANVVDVKQFSNKKIMPLRDILHKKSLSKREKLRYQYLNQMPSRHKDNSTKLNIMRDQFIHAQMKTSSDQANHLSEDYRTRAGKKNETTTPGKQCTKDTIYTLKKMKVKIEPELKLQNPASDVNPATFKQIKVKVEPKYEENEYSDSTENSKHSHIHKDGSHRDIDLKLKTEPGLVSLLKRRQDVTALEDTIKYSTLKGILGTTAAPQSKEVVDLREKHSPNKSRTKASKSKSKSTAPAKLTINAPKASVSFAPYKSKMPVNLKPTAESKTLKTSSTAQGNQNLENRSNTVPLVQNAPLLLTNTNQVSSPQVPLQYVLTGVNATGTQNSSQVILAGSNSSPARLVLTGLNAPLGAQNPTHVVLTGANATGSQNQTVVLTNPNQLTSTTPSQIVLTNANRPPTSQCSQLILANGNTSGPPRFLLANTNQNLPVTQSAQQIVLTNANQAVPNQGQQQIVYANMYTNPNQTNVAQTGQLVLNKIVQQLQQQTNVLNIPSSPQIQPQTITGAQIRSIVPSVQESAIGQSTITAIQQPVPVIQTSSVLPSTMNFPPGTLFLKQNCLPEQIPQSGLQALTKLMAEKQNKQAHTVVNIGPKGPENMDFQPTLPVQGKTVTIGNQKYILVPTVSQGSPAQTSLNAGVSDNSDNLLYDGFSKLSVAKKMKLLLERSEDSKNQEQALLSQSINSTSSKTALLTSIPSEAKPVKSPAVDTASVIKEAKQILPTDSPEKSLSNKQTNTDDVIFIDDTDIVPVDVVQKNVTYPRKRNPRKSKPQPRLDYDEFLKKQRKSKQNWKQIYSSDENESTDNEDDIETVDIEPEMAGKGMLIPKTPTMPPGLYQWPDGATIDEKSITLPPSLLQDMNIPTPNDNTE